MLVLALLPGIPMLPFLALGGGAGGARLSCIDKRTQSSAAAAEAQKTEAAAKADAAEEPIATALKIDDLKIELGYALLPLVNAPDGTDRLTEQIKALRRSLAVEMGFVMPAVRILDNVQLEANTYVIKIKEVDAGTGKIWPNQFMVMDPAGDQVKLPGMHTTEPTFGLPATWVDAALKEEASHEGLHGGRRRHRAVDASDRAAQEQHGGPAVLWRGAEAAQGTAEGTGRTGQGHRAEPDHGLRHPARAADCCWPSASRSAISPPSSKASPTRWPFSRNPATMVEHVRARLARQICAQNTAHNGYLPLIALSAKWEQAFAEIDGRHRATSAPRHAALATVGVHHAGPRTLRGGRPRRRGAGAGDLVERPAVRARDRRALPRADAVSCRKAKSIRARG